MSPLRIGIPVVLAAGIAAAAWLEAPGAPVPQAPEEPQDTAITVAVIALGDSIFHGRAAGGLCQSCHRPDGKGLPGLAPDLTDAKWLHGDGSLPFIATVVTKGVPKPKQSAAPMMPYGGGPKMSVAQVRAVAAYVKSLSAPRK